MFERITTFLKEARIELKKVTWPSREDTVHHTITVIVISIFLAAFLGALDILFQFILNNFIL
jgi:preprotein translocase subunit SecE